jgi:hypothetical protein
MSPYVEKSYDFIIGDSLNSWSFKSSKLGFEKGSTGFRSSSFLELGS